MNTKGATAFGIVAVVAAAIGVAIARDPLTGTGALFAVVLLVGAFALPRQAIIVVVVVAMLQYLPVRAIPVLPQEAVLLDDLILVGIVLRLVADLALSRVRVRFWILGPLVGFILVAVASTLVNRVAPVWTANALRALLLPMALVPAAAVYLEEPKDRLTLLNTIVALAVINAVASFVQWLSNPASPDIGWGFLGPGGANGSGFLSLIGLILALVAPWSFRRRALAMLILGAGLLVSSARAAILIAPAALLIAGWRNVGGTRARRVVSILLVVVLTFGVLFYYQSAGRDLGDELSPASVLEGQQVAGQGGRLLYLRAVPAVWADSELGAVWGVGPGSYTSFVGMNRLAPAFVRQAPVRADSVTGYAFPDMQWTSLLGEYGVLGTLAAVLLVLLPTIHARRLSRVLASPVDGALGIAMPALLLVWIAGMTAVNLMEYGPVVVPLWALLGASVSTDPLHQGLSESSA
jgi:hypothetical protein